MNLQLSLKTKWFEMTKAGIKTEDYREITPYWCNKLLMYSHFKQSSNFWEFQLIAVLANNRNIMQNTFVKPLIFDNNTMTLGYPKSTNNERILKLEHKGIEIRTGNPEWGAEPNKLYFVIKHGKIIQ